MPGYSYVISTFGILVLTKPPWFLVLFFQYSDLRSCTWDPDVSITLQIQLFLGLVWAECFCFWLIMSPLRHSRIRLPPLTLNCDAPCSRVLPISVPFAEFEQGGLWTSHGWCRSYFKKAQAHHFAFNSLPNLLLTSLINFGGPLMKKLQNIRPEFVKCQF